MQSLVIFLAALLGAAIANPMVFSSDDIKEQNKAISSTEYLKKIFKQNWMVSDTDLSAGHDDLLAMISELRLNETVEIAKRVDLRQILKDDRLATVTLFVPSNEAVQKWRRELPERMRPDDEAMKKLVKAWIVPGMIRSDQVTNNRLVESFNGAKLRFNVFADELRRRVITVNGAKIIKADKLGATGIIHVVDKVIFPLPIGDVMETLKDIPSFSVIVDLIKKTDLATSLKSIKPVTVLVPTNTAFQALPEGVLDNLKKNPAKLEKVLRYHVIDDVRYSASLKSGTEIMASQKDVISVHIENGKVRLNKDKKESQSNVIMADIPTTNGVIHVIDHVLIPRDQHYTLA